MIKHNPLNFKVGDTAYLDGNLECTIQSISDKGMFCVVISPLYSTPYEVMTYRLLRENVLKDTPVYVKLKQHLDSITQEEFDKEWNEVVQSMEGVESPTMEEFINNQKDLEPEYSEIIRDNFWGLVGESIDLEKMEQNLNTQLESETTESLNEWLYKKRIKSDMEAYEQQYEYESELEREACIDFAKWLAQDWMSIWVGDKWMWECQTDGVHLGYKTEEELYELYIKQQG